MFLFVLLSPLFGSRQEKEKKKERKYYSQRKYSKTPETKKETPQLRRCFTFVLTHKY